MTYRLTVMGHGSMQHVQIHDEAGYVCTLPPSRADEILKPELAQLVKEATEKKSRCANRGDSLKTQAISEEKS